MFWAWTSSLWVLECVGALCMSEEWLTSNKIAHTVFGSLSLKMVSCVPSWCRSLGFWAGFSACVGPSCRWDLSKVTKAMCLYGSRRAVKRMPLYPSHMCPWHIWGHTRLRVKLENDFLGLVWLNLCWCFNIQRSCAGANRILLALQASADPRKVWAAEPIPLLRLLTAERSQPDFQVLRWKGRVANYENYLRVCKENKNS